MNTGFLFVFLLGHFLGDFVFQTNQIAKMKSQEIRGVLFHSVIVLILQAGLLSMFGMKGIIAALISSIIHFIIDYVKLRIGKYTARITFLYFILDQALHIAVIVMLTYEFKPSAVLNDSITLYTKYALLLILFTYIMTVMSKMLVRDLFETIRNQSFFLGKERILDGAVSLFIFICFISLNSWAAIFFILMICLIYFILHKKLYSYSSAVIAIKFSFYFIAGYAGKIIFAYLIG